MKPTGGIEDNHIIAVIPRMFYSILCHLNGIFTFLGVDVDIKLLTKHNQLLDSGGPSEVIGDQ